MPGGGANHISGEGICLKRKPRGPSVTHEYVIAHGRREQRQVWGDNSSSRNYILTTYQSDAGSAGIFSRRTNDTKEAR
eukprot:2824775-Pyramimonas_sp.AAC.1